MYVQYTLMSIIFGVILLLFGTSWWKNRPPQPRPTGSINTKLGVWLRCDMRFANIRKFCIVFLALRRLCQLVSLYPIRMGCRNKILPQGLELHWYDNSGYSDFKIEHSKLVSLLGAQLWKRSDFFQFWKLQERGASESVKSKCI